MGHWIAFKGVAHLIKWVLRESNSTRKSKQQGFTALHYATLNGHLEAVKALLEVKGGKAALNVKDRYGETPIDLAKRKSHREIVSYLENIE